MADQALRLISHAGALFFVLCSLFLLSSVAVLLQPNHGQFSGAPVKEQWREAVTSLAGELHPDDLLVLHPYYALPLWQYYAPRVTPDPLPAPTVFPLFGEGSCVVDNRGDAQAISACFKRSYDPDFNQAASGKKRALLLIAPDHAATIDPPKTLEDLQADYKARIIEQPPTEPDAYGWMGLRFLYPQRLWTCGPKKFLGVETMCQSFPELFRATAGEPSAPPAPAVPLEATFGGEVQLRGYTINLFGGQARPGGALPITLYWQSQVNPTKNYSMFLHLCQNCEQPPLAGVDDAPLRGYAPAGLTSTWRGYPVHDERSLALPDDLAPGRYTLILGVRPADEDPSNLSLRLPVTGTQAEVHGGTRLVLGEIDIAAK
ncbi:MAG: hypothetical protein H7Z42_11930 [Roseiflexaceae bacterium]|nr:hypothetical protein [Roseiflexaceae bacterium]